jgi:hypothetical protein
MPTESPTNKPGESVEHAVAEAVKKAVGEEIVAAVGEDLVNQVVEEAVATGGVGGEMGQEAVEEAVEEVVEEMGQALVGQAAEEVAQVAVGSYGGDMGNLDDPTAIPIIPTSKPSAVPTSKPSVVSTSKPVVPSPVPAALPTADQQKMGVTAATTSDSDAVLITTPSPTPVPGVPCADGNHGCDSQTTKCVLVQAMTTIVDGAYDPNGLVAVCECLDGLFTSPDSPTECLYTSAGDTPSAGDATAAADASTDGCGPNVFALLGCDEVTQLCSPLPSPHCTCKKEFVGMCDEPTGNPTVAPTFANMCDEPRGCDTVSTACITIALDESSSSYICQCLDGFDQDPTNLQACLAVPTMAPTASMLVGTGSPSISPTYAPTARPTVAQCADGNHGCDPASTICISMLVEEISEGAIETGVVISCQCLDSFLPNPNNASVCTKGGAVALVPTVALDTMVPTHAPSWDACADGTHGCDAATTRCSFVETGEGGVVTCQCLEGHSRRPDTMMACASIDPTKDDLQSLWTPAPTPPPPTPRQSGCDPATSTTKWREYCALPDRTLTALVFPIDTENLVCAGSVVEEEVPDLQACVKHCSVTLGGPPFCSFVKYYAEERRCLWSAACASVVTAVDAYETDETNQRRIRRIELEHERLNEAHEEHAVGARRLAREVQSEPQPDDATLLPAAPAIYSLQCVFSRDLYETCKWAQDSANSKNALLGLPPLPWGSSLSTSTNAGWKELHSLVQSALADGSTNTTATTELPIVGRNIGLAKCRSDCASNTSCQFFAYSEELVLCVQLEHWEGSQDLAEKCAYISTPDSTLQTPSTADVQGDFMRKWTVHMIDDADFVLYGGEAHAEDEQCDCINGYIPAKDKLENTRCMPNGTHSDSLAGVDSSQCSAVLVKGPFPEDVTVDADSLSAALSTYYQDCTISWACTAAAESRCVINTGRCTLAHGSAWVRSECSDPVLDPMVQQPGQLCKAADFGLAFSVQVTLEACDGTFADASVRGANSTVYPSKAPTKAPAVESTKSNTWAHLRSAVYTGGENQTVNQTGAPQTAELVSAELVSTEQTAVGVGGEGTHWAGTMLVTSGALAVGVLLVVVGVRKRRAAAFGVNQHFSDNNRGKGGSSDNYGPSAAALSTSLFMPHSRGSIVSAIDTRGGVDEIEMSRSGFRWGGATGSALASYAAGGGASPPAAHEERGGGMPLVPDAAGVL